MARLRLIVVVFVTWLVVAAVNPVVNADAYAYDVPVTSCVDIHCLGAAEAITDLLSDVREVSATRSAEGRGTSTTVARSFTATNTGVGGPDFNQAMNQALEWLLARGFKAEVPTIGKFGSTTGRPIGMQTADGKVGFRVEFDARSGAHINVWAAKEKGPHFTFAASEATVERIQRPFEKC